MIETVLVLGHRVFVIDPEREYLRLAVDLHAPYVELGRQSVPWHSELDSSRPDNPERAFFELAEKYESLAAANLSDVQAQALSEVSLNTASDGRFLGIPELLASLRNHPSSEARELARV